MQERGKDAITLSACWAVRGGAGVGAKREHAPNALTAASLLVKRQVQVAS